MRNKSLSKDHRGISALTFLVFGAIVAVICYCAYYVMPFYYYYYELQAHMQQAIKVASTETDQEIRKRLMYHIKQYELPVDPEELKIERLEGRMKISLPYKEIFYINWKGKDYIIHEFDFHAYAEGDY